MERDDKGITDSDGTLWIRHQLALYLGILNYSQSRSKIALISIKILTVMARGWLIERARTKRLRAELEEYKDFACHRECCRWFPGGHCGCGYSDLPGVELCSQGEDK